MLEITKTDYKLMKTLENEKLTIEEISQSLNQPFNIVLDYCDTLKNENYLSIDLLLNVELNSKGRTAIKRFRENKWTNFKLSFWYPLIYTILGVLIGVVASILAG